METKIDFDYSIGTEDRFALRNWFEAFVESQNSTDAEEIKVFLSVGLVAEGFSDESLNKEGFAKLMQREKQSGTLEEVRYVDLKVKYKDEAYVFVGSFEGFSNNILTYEGTIELEVIKSEEDFSVDFIKFYPRLKVTA